MATVVTAAVTMASPASAIIVQRPGANLSYQPLNGHGPSAQQLAGANITYHGGAVMHSSTQYAIFWAPSGSSFPGGYESAIVKYLQDVAADSGKATNVYSIATEYTDSSGRAAYQATFGGAFDVTDDPGNGCAPYSGFTRCLTDAQLQTELNSVIAAHGLPRNLATMYSIFLPPTVGQCLSSTGASCFAVQFCAYHAAFSPTTLYTSQPYAPITPSGCGTRQYPNGSPVDDELSSVSHEANEVITDPLPGSGWFDTNTSHENGDLCRNTGSFAGDYGSPLGGVPGSLFNQIINNSHYILQQEWSNGANAGAGGCEQRYNLTGSVSAPGSGVAGKPQSFSATGTDAEGGTVTGISWDFGDGGAGSGPSATHVFTSAGTFQVTAQIANSTGLTATATQQIRVSRPSNRFSFGRAKLNKRKGTATLPVRVPGAGKLKLSGKNLARQRTGAKRKRTVKLLVKPKRDAKQALARTGKARVKAKVTYTPNFGVARTKTQKLALVKKR